MTALFIPPQTVSHPTVQPYISLQEYQDAPTDVDTEGLTTGGSIAGNAIELANVIARATAWTTDICHQILAATLDTQTAMVRVRRDGSVWLPCDFWPVRELDAFASGPPGNLLALESTAAAGIYLQGRKVIVVPGQGGTLISPRGSWVNVGFAGNAGDTFCQWAYWNGWFHSTLAADCAGGDTEIVVRTPFPQAAAGCWFEIPDGAATELVQVALNFMGGTTIPLVSELVNPHTPGPWPAYITVTELPADARQATVSLTSALIKTRGNQSYEMGSVGSAPTTKELTESGGIEDVAVATRLLVPRYERTT